MASSAEAEPVSALRAAGERELFEEFRARVRAAGEQWAGHRQAGLTELLCAAVADDPELVSLARAGAWLIEDFVEGLSRTGALASGDLATDLIEGRTLPFGVLPSPADVYTVVVTRLTAEMRYDELAEQGVLHTRKSDLLVLLVPDNGSGLLGTITAGLAGWVATARRPVAGLAAAYTEAAEVLRLVMASCRPAGVYAMTDVLVEHAIVGNASVSAQLARIIRPVRENQVLWQTLVAVVRADFNRNRAARDLAVHRSTMDYRLQRIAKITGWDLAGSHGDRLLSAALVVDAVA